MTWMSALKKWNAHHKSININHVWMVPRKGTPEHADVMNIVNYYKPQQATARREGAVEQLREATKGMKPGVRKDDAEAKRQEVVAQLREATKGMKPGVRKDDVIPEAPKKSVNHLLPFIAGQMKPEAKEVKQMELPEDIVTQNIMPFVKGLDFNLAKVFVTGKKELDKKALSLINLLDMIAEGEDNDFFIGKSTEYPQYNGNDDFIKDLFLTEYTVPGDPKSKYDYNRKDYVVKKHVLSMEMPDKAQMNILMNGFPNYAMFSIYRRVGTMSNKSGLVFKVGVDTSDLNLRTKVGREEKDKRRKEIATIAKGYLERLKAKPDFFNFVKGKSQKMLEDRKSSNTEAMASIQWPKSEETAIVVPGTADALYKYYLAYLNNPARAKSESEKIEKLSNGRSIKLWIPRKILSLKWVSR
jgi:hypothetical protein